MHKEHVKQVSKTFTTVYTIRKTGSGLTLYGVYASATGNRVKLGTQQQCIAYCVAMDLSYTLDQ